MKVFLKEVAKRAAQGDSSAADARVTGSDGTMWQEERAVTVVMFVATVLFKLNATRLGETGPVFSALGLTPLHALLPRSAETSIITPQMSLLCPFSSLKKLW